MRPIKLLTGICLCCILFVPAQAAIDPPLSIGAKSAALGHAYVGVRGDFWSLFHNPSGIAGLQSPSFGLHVERRFQLKELTYAAAGLALPFTDQQAVGIQFSTFGFSAYRETQVAGTYAISLFERFSLGAKVNYAGISIQDYGNSSAIFVDVGINTALSNELSVGISAYNVNRARIKTTTLEEDLPTQLSVGIAYKPSDKVLFVADVQKVIDQPESFRGGIEYQLVDILAIRLGVSSEPLTWNTGIELALNNLALDVTFGYHERLGFTPYLSLGYTLGNRITRSPEPYIP